MVLPGLLMPPTASELISAVSHPLRRRILLAYVDGLVVSPSARELADAMDQRVAQVAYHLKTLTKGGILLLVRSDGGQEAEEERYGWVLGVEPEWLRLVLEVWAESDLTR